ncbi:MAG: hypothetical protein ACRC92_12740 [Peptostreptococcaceae bacterium]
MTCSKCNTNSKSIASIAKSTYYCCDCEKETVLKNVAIDSILVQLTKSLKLTHNAYLKIELVKKESELDLVINNIVVKSINFNYSFSKTDIYYLESTISYLIEDNCNIENTKIDVLICA